MTTPAPVKFRNETEFEDAVIFNLTHKYGWSPNVLSRPSEADLIANWARIVFENNNTPDRLNGVPLSDIEVETLVQEIAALHSPAAVQRWLQGREVILRRNNPADALNHGREIPLTIFSPSEVGGGDSTYQIARQPRFNRKNPISRDRRGDFTLLIWGLPLIHVELKNESHDVSEAAVQAQRYAREGVWSGFFSLVQVFVAMTPTDMRYFANPGDPAKFNDDFFFIWTDEDNERYSDWQGVTQHVLGIPPAHRLIGDYLVADGGDGVLKVLRPYQVHAVESILLALRKINREHRDSWTKNTHKGGFIWHTTGSGKTMTSFTAAQLIAREHLADKVVFVLDRVELSEQSEIEYTNFAGDMVELTRPANSYELVRDLKSKGAPLIITSLHKLGIISDPKGDFKDTDFTAVDNKRLVFVVDEAHRTTFGEMFSDLTTRFPHAVYFGFTGTPIRRQNARKDTITADLFGNELHRYSIYYGLRDGNVLEFHTVPVSTFDDNDLRHAVALRKANAKDMSEVTADEKRLKIYNTYMDETKVPWTTVCDPEGKRVLGIEQIAKTSTWETEAHRQAVVDYMLKHWDQHSSGRELHALFATSSVLEAIDYYRRFKADGRLKVTAVFTDANQNTTDALERDAGIEEILADYNAAFGTTFTVSDHADFRSDAADRLAHRRGYKRVSKDEQLDLVIVVDQLLTGYDSKYISTLYLDKVLDYAALVQAFSRTNRVFNHLLKPFGTIVYFRQVHTMKRNIEQAFDLYAGRDALAVFVDPLPITIAAANEQAEAITSAFTNAGILDYSHLPDDPTARRKFASAYAELTRRIESARIQGFEWDMDTLTDDEGNVIEVGLTKDEYDTWTQRYAELAEEAEHNPETEGIPLDLEAMARARSAKVIDAEYLDERFRLWREAVAQPKAPKAKRDDLMEQLRREYAKLPTEDQEAADQIILAVMMGAIDAATDTRSLRELIELYKASKQASHVEQLLLATALDRSLVEETLTLVDGTMTPIRAYGRFDRLQSGVDMGVFGGWLQDHGVEASMFECYDLADRLLTDYFTRGGFDLETWGPLGK